MGKDTNEIVFDDKVLTIRAMEERMTGGRGWLPWQESSVRSEHSS